MILNGNLTNNHKRQEMKKYKFLYILAIAGLFATACEDEDIVNPILPPAEVGDAIIFGARAGFENAYPTRTEYSGVSYSLDNKVFERIDWIDGDKVQITCPQADGVKFAHYKVTGFSVGDEDPGTTNKGSDYAYLESLATEEEDMLQWSATTTHDFYAMYPSEAMFYTENTISVPQGLKMEGSKIYGVVPFAQMTTNMPTQDSNNPNHYIFKPNMNYAYMVAKTSTTREAAAGGVGLSFMPIVTAVEITVETQDMPIEMSEIQITSTQNITGSFMTDLEGWNGTDYPAIEATNEVAPGKLIQISFNEVFTLGIGQSLTFTVFLLPGETIPDLTIGFSATGAGYLRKKLGTVTDANGNVTHAFAGFPSSLKTKISGLTLPKKPEEDEPDPFVIDASKWMEQLSDTTKIGALSLPGTGASFSYGLDSTDIYHRAQTLTFDRQWAAGIRAFEASLNRKYTVDNTIGGFANEPITCNGEELTTNEGGTTTKITLNWVVQNLLAKLKENPDETAMLILTYQPIGNNPGRDAESFATDINNYVTNNIDQSKLVRFSPNLKLLDKNEETGAINEANSARGKLMIVVRPTQLDEDNATTRSDAIDALTNTNILAIDGCGTAKDKWGARGYKINFETDIKGAISGHKYYYSYSNRTPSNISNNPIGYNEGGAGFGQYEQLSGGSNTVEGFMNSSYIFATSNVNSSVTNNNNGNPIGVTRPGADGTLNFEYGTNAGYQCWFQEWARVIPQNMNIASGYWDDPSTTNDDRRNYPAVYWFESYNEKLSHVTRTFDMAISGQFSDKYVFINSLCGYMATTSYTNSLVPSINYAYGGDGGDIGALANLLNPAFYKYVRSSGMANATGPTGIVLMDRVTNTRNTSLDASEDGSYFLPGTIIANNFKGTGGVMPDNGTSGGGGNTGSGSGDGTGGGNTGGTDGEEGFN